ncbi:hypothetical protein PAENIP36_12760 [Paenibacillus sp. P36]
MPSFAQLPRLYAQFNHSDTESMSINSLRYVSVNPLVERSFILDVDLQLQVPSLDFGEQ